MGDDKSNKKIKHLDDVASITSQGIQGASTVLGVAGEIAPALVPIYKLSSLIKEIGSVLKQSSIYCVKLLSFSIDVKITGQVKSISNELEQFKIDQDDLAKYLQDMVAGV
ncbi:unnamed protein product [Rhizophagus irregularis]|nr:unnamed protein product [Rhizophagus irregularis]